MLEMKRIRNISAACAELKSTFITISPAHISAATRRSHHGVKIPPRLEWRSGDARSGTGNEARQSVGFTGCRQRHIEAAN
jgi:hypothetical protein